MAVNPYKHLSIYDPDVVAQYHGKQRADLAPHLFSIGEEAYRDMLSSLSSAGSGGAKVGQAILCTGESGAGKTENTKYLVRFFVQVTAAPSGREQAGRRRSSRTQVCSVHIVFTHMYCIYVYYVCMVVICCGVHEMS